ncbi:MAG: ABC transporter ATP-binding protein [Elusimicrobia bacterium]|nr:ABC transporter ATP-binding protein [Elusimicrobiota bacterium]MDE2424567.1 ABC transporter ATP-binding protein [Elusimicrobiota bacterium]
MIEAKGIFKSFGSRPVLCGVDIAVQDGETLCIIGGSGCGKSTFLKCVIGLVRPDQGSISVDGMDIAGLSAELDVARYRRRFGYLFQEAALFDSLTVWENVSFGLRYLTDVPQAKFRQIARDKLALVGLKDIEDFKPAELSGGMKKRVGLARAIAAEPGYILYDEPTTGLDPIMSDVINDLIIDLQKKLKVTSIVVTHDMKSAYKIASRIAMLHEGQVQAVDRPEAIKASSDPVIRQFVEGRSEGPIKMKLRDFEPGAPAPRRKAGSGA